MDINDIHKELGLKKINEGSYRGVYSTGDFDGIHDYGAGLLGVLIFITATAKDKYTVGLTIYTIDDGGWQACDVKTDYDKEAAIERMEQVAQSFIEYMYGDTKLPSEKDLNKHLMTLSLWGEFTG